MNGFLGVAESSLKVVFDRPIVILVGPNASGKSTVVQAVEWALFGGGQEVKGTSLDTHRVYIHRACEEAWVHLRFECDGHELEWRRLRHVAKPRPDDDTVSCRLDGEPVEADAGQLLGLTHELFERVVAPGQGDLQALTSGDKTKRGAALDRLFGIERFNSLTVGLSKARRDLDSRRKALRGRVDGLASSVRFEISRRFETRLEARRAALGAGVPATELVTTCAVAAARELARKLDAPAMAGDDLAGLRAAVARLRQAADKRWADAGASERETRLRALQRIATTLRDGWQGTVSELFEGHADLERIIKEHGDAVQLEGELTKAFADIDEIKASLRAANARGDVLVAAREWLKAQSGAADRSLKCPVCVRPIVATELDSLVEGALSEAGGTVAELQVRRAEALEHYQAVENQINAVQRQRQNIEEVAARERQLGNALFSELRREEAKLPGKPDRVEGPVAGVVRKALQLPGVEGLPEGEPFPTAALNVTLGRLAEEVAAALQKTSADVANASTAKQALRERVLALEKTVDFLEAADRLDELDELVGSADVSAAVAGADAVDSEVETLQAVVQAAEQVSESEAQARIDAVEPRLNEWFGRLSRHDSLRGAKVSVTTTRGGGSKNSYTILARSDDGWEVAPGPMLSGGYRTALAVAALCALSDDDNSHIGLGLLALDEPTQSLDPTMTVQMGRALGANIELPTLLVTTTEESFATALRDSAGASKVRVLRVSDWTAAQGTRIEGLS